MEKFYNTLKEIKKMNLDFSMKKDKKEVWKILQSLEPDYTPECNWLKRIIGKGIHLEFINKKDVKLSEKKQIVGRVRKRLEAEEGLGEKAIEKMLTSLIILGGWEEEYDTFENQENILQKGSKDFEKTQILNQNRNAKNEFNIAKDNKSKLSGQRVIRIVAIIIVIFIITVIFYTLYEKEQTRKEIENKKAEIANAKIGDSVIFGTENLKWRILAKEKDEVLLITEEILEKQPYNEEDAEITWEECTLRKWLNEDFYNNTFIKEEKELIKISSLSNPDNEKWEIEGGNDTKDKIFLLNLVEAKKYFDSDKERKASDWWWLRSPGYDAKQAAFVYANGDITTRGMNVDLKDIGVRPALWLKIK